MGSPTASPPLRAEGEWSPMHFHVRTYLAGHPLLHGFEVRTEAGEAGLTAELRYYSRSVRSRRDGVDWWRPGTPRHARDLADLLAHDLYAKWLQLLRQG